MVLGGQQYYEARFIVPAVIMGCVFQFAYTMNVNIEQYTKKTVGMSIASVSAAVLNCVLNAALIPKFGYGAAAYTTFISYIWLYIIHCYLVKRLGYADTYNNSSIWIMMAGLTAFMFVSIWLYSYTTMRWAVIAVYTIVFVIIFIKNKKLLLQFIPGKA